MAANDLDFGVNLAFVEEMRERFDADPTALDPAWHRFFDGGTADLGAASVLQERVQRLVEAYRNRGHLHADLDPLDLAPRRTTGLELEAFGLSAAHLDRTFVVEDMPGRPTKSLREIVATLQETYCRTIGVELAHIVNPDLRRWIEGRMESTRNHLDLSREDQIRILTLLTDARSASRWRAARA
jgi:2-oxoglutarate dehydrogenase E1 component